MIKIGVSACFLYPDPNRQEYGTKNLVFLENELAKYLYRDGVVPVLIPDLPPKQLRRLLLDLDGFVFQGGMDIAPQTYWEKPLFHDKWQGDPHRDLYELEILEFAIKHRKPVFGICRGFHLLNVYFGGTLYQDILSQRPGSITHQKEENLEDHMHGIDLSSGMLLEQLYRRMKTGHVNSQHHQGVCEIGNNLEVLARCKEDQIIEAFTWKGAEEGEVMGVQWHPEYSSAKERSHLPPDPLYYHFLQKCFIRQKKL